jgi:glucose-1-phosphate cytidylyltransferase
MKVVILAGGLGTRLSEETNLKPKPMVEIGGKPIIWHIMKMYSHYGHNEFIICCGYKGYIIKEYFANYSLHQSDVTFDLSNNEIKVHKDRSENWKVTLVDTGNDTMTGGRLGKLKEYLKDEKYFAFTYGDGVSNINVDELEKFHNNHSKQATITAVYPPGRFGALKINKKVVENFEEKPRGDGALINGGFFILSPKVFSKIENDQTIWEQDPLKNLSSEKQLMAYVHSGFWQSMDTLRDKNYLNNLWINNQAPWKIWN